MKMDPAEIAQNVAAITGALKSITTARGESNFVIINADWKKNSYIQALAHGGDPLIYLEAVGNRYWQDKSRPISLIEMLRLGWQVNRMDPDENFYRYWKVEGPEDQERLAALILQTFHEVYNIPRDRLCTLEIHNP